MRKKRRNFDASFKAKVAIEALKERETLNELAVKYDLHPNQISTWKQEFLSNSSAAFEITAKTSSDEKKKEEELEKLYSKIGMLEMEKDFLKKSLKKLGL